MNKKKILIIYYSYSSQTRRVVQAFAAGCEEYGVEIIWQQLKTREKLQFPLGSVFITLVMMVETFFRKRFAIEPIDEELFQGCDFIILAGPTWSYNPSGPMLDFFDKYGALLNRKTVLPLISCRGYWRMHYWQLKYMLRKKRAQVLGPVVFLHTGPEPWRTIGVFLKLAGKIPESGRTWISRYYNRFGHSREQVDLARRMGRELAEVFLDDEGIEKMKGSVVSETVADIN